MAYKEVSRDGHSGSHPALAEKNQSPAHSLRDGTLERHGPEIRCRSRR